MQAEHAHEQGPLHDDVRGAIGRTIADWRGCHMDDIHTLKKGFQCSGLSMTYTGTFELQGIDFAVFVSVDNSRFFFYAVEHGWFFETGGPFS